MFSDLTYKVVALSEVIQLDPNECIDWAIEMIELGYDTPNLLMLSSFNKSASYFEIIPYLKSAIQELGMKMKNGDGGVISYSYYYIKEISLGKRIRLNLAELYAFCQQRDYEGIIYDFYLLHWAWDEIDYEDLHPNHYWEGVNKENIERTVVKVANEWLEENKQHYMQNSLKMN
jgi:hypothetical protein